MNSSRTAASFGLVQAGIVLLTLLTAFIHISINIQMGGFLFILNGLGYLALLAALFLPQALVERILPPSLSSRFRQIVRYLFIAYTLLTIVLWVIMGTRSTLAYVDKIAEVLLVGLLWLDRARG